LQRRRPLQFAVEVLLGKSHVEHIPREYRIFCVPHLQKIRKGKPLFLQRTLERFRAAREEGAGQGASDAAGAPRGGAGAGSKADPVPLNPLPFCDSYPCSVAPRAAQSPSTTARPA